MGSTTVSSDEQPVHQVTVPSFEMTESEVTVQQYGACVTAGACTAPDTGTNCNWNDPGYEDHPVNCVDWNQAKEFCTWAGGRLPSEAEWEFAARSGGQDIEYPWGDDAATCSYAVMDDDTHTDGCDTGRTWSVCSITAGNSAQGLCDLAGNVWEWVEDDYHSDYTGAPADGSAWVESPRSSHRVRRGGCFSFYAFHLRAAERYYYAPSDRLISLGFRCVK
jgi:formylglycine-generating enzyme required for sulfatase activity